MKIKNKLGLILLIILALVPLFFWLMAEPSLKFRFINWSATLTSLGQVSGLVGLALFALTLMLSGRFKFLENYFGGLDKIYQAHRLGGVIAFCLLLAHPLLLAVNYWRISAASAARFLLPGSDWALNFGIIALGLLIIFLALTFYAKLPYQIWKVTHKFLGMAFFSGGLHALLIESDISRQPLLRFYLLTLAALALAVYVYRTILGHWLVKKFAYTVQTVRLLGDQVVEITMSPQRQKIKFTAGQFIFVKFNQTSFNFEWHPFSLTSDPAASELKISVKMLGDYTNELPKLKAGTLVKIEGPFGRFSCQNFSAKEQIWIAGGIGITPFLSMVRAGATANRKIDLYYCVKQLSEAVFLDELKNIAAHSGRLRLRPIISQDAGQLTADAVAEFSGDLNNKEIMICGPASMMAGLKKQFLQLAVERRQIHCEEFRLAR